MKTVLVFCLALLTSTIYSQTPETLGRDKRSLKAVGATRDQAIHNEELPQLGKLSNALALNLPSMTMSGLRRGLADTASVILIVDRGKFGYFMFDPTDVTSTDDSAMTVTFNSRRYKRIVNGPINVKWFGAEGDGKTNNDLAFQKAIDYVSLFSKIKNDDGKQIVTPGILVPAGVYNISKGLNVNVRNFSITGEGTAVSYIHLTSLDPSAVLFDIGTSGVSVGNAFHGVEGAPITQGPHIADINLIGPSRPAAHRSGQAIRQTGSGGLIIHNVKISGFGWGINSVSGGDFNEYTHVSVEYCNTGVYFGPGAQQVHCVNLEIAVCIDGLVLDRFAHGTFDNLVVNDCEHANIVFESFANTATRQLRSVGGSGVTMHTQTVFNQPWLESNSGGRGNSAIPNYFIEFRSANVEAYRNITINQPRIFAGTTPERRVRAIIGKSGGGPSPQNVFLNNASYSGSVDAILHDTEAIVTNFSTENGYSLPPLTNTPLTESSTLFTNDRSRITKYTGSTYSEEISNVINTEGIKTKIHPAGKVSYAFNTAGKWVQRFGLDVPNAKIILGNPDSTALSIDRGTSAPITGSFAEGSIRINASQEMGSPILWQCIAGGKPGRWAPVFAASETKSVTTSSDGTSIEIFIPHGLSTIPSFFDARAVSPAAAGISYLTADSTNIIIHYTTPPARGTNNLSYNLQLKP